MKITILPNQFWCTCHVGCAVLELLGLGCGDGEEIGGFDDMQGRSAGIARDFVNKYLYFPHRSYIFFRTLYI